MQQPVDFYCHPTPNPSKVAYFLEKSGIANRLIPVDIAKGDQHSAEFRALNQNGKVPVAAENGIAILDSSAILLPPPPLLHLAKKAGASSPPYGDGLA
ncbi:TPA: glutathione S-transferase N-terminal domain-containing protein [Pseudomonas aeruginosa]